MYLNTRIVIFWFSILIVITLVSPGVSMIKFCANLDFLFTEHTSLLQRYAAAKQAGFKSVESSFPSNFSKEEVLNAKNAAGIEQVLMNMYTGSDIKYPMGVGAIPGKEIEFKEALTKTVDYARALGVKKIHILAGIIDGEVTKENDNTYIENLKYSSKILEKENILGVIEPINNYDKPNYYLNNFEKAISILKTLNTSNIKLQLDTYHLQLIKGDLTHSIENYKPYIGHVQIAQVPNRNEPDTKGEINYQYLFDVLERVYGDWIGCEYNPLNGTVPGLKWIKEMGYSF